MQKVIVIAGPTASGKTGLSVALAQKIKAEIVSADSMQIYDRMNIGTAKPSEEERQGIAHHLMGHVSVEECYNVASYVKDATRVLDELKQRKVLPILCGGTGLYLDHLLMNTDFFDIPVHESVRLVLQKEYMECGGEIMLKRLAEVDPILAQKLHPNDEKRIIRGLEVYKTTGKRLSSFQEESKRPSKYRSFYIGLNFKNRELLYERINRRVDLMIENGLEKEVRELLANTKLSATARAAIGYKELIDAIEAGAPLAPAIDLIKQKSRNYAKRQLTWFRRNPDIHWFYVDECSEKLLIDQVYELVEAFIREQ